MKGARAAKGTKIRGREARHSAAPRAPRTARLFPAVTFEEALVLPAAIWEHAQGERVRRLTLFDSMGKSPESGPSRQLITNSARYGLTTGSYTAEYLDLTPLGKAATNPDSEGVEKTRARYQLAIDQVPVFNALYENYQGKKLPSPAVIRDFLREQSLPDDHIQEAIETFTLNAKHLGLLKVMGGAERVISLAQLLEEAPRRVPATEVVNEREPTRTGRVPARPTSGDIDWSTICFYVTPIGHMASEERLHSDLFLGSLVEPAVQEFGLIVVRADQIGKPGMITAQVIEHLAKARLVIADLSFHNPNVFYEVALRHARRLPVVQITRASDPLPFDLDQFRTVQIDTTTIYTLVPRLESYRAEIANHIRRSLSETSDVDNPLTAFYPSFWD